MLYEKTRSSHKRATHHNRACAPYYIGKNTAFFWHALAIQSRASKFFYRVFNIGGGKNSRTGNKQRSPRSHHRANSIHVYSSIHFNRACGTRVVESAYFLKGIRLKHLTRTSGYHGECLNNIYLWKKGQYYIRRRAGRNRHANSDIRSVARVNNNLGVLRCLTVKDNATYNGL